MYHSIYLLVSISNVSNPSFLLALISDALTGEDVVQVPGQHPVQDSVQSHHADGGEKGELVPLQRAGLYVVPLQTQTLFFIPRQVLCPKAKGHLRKQTLMEEATLESFLLP